MRRSRKLIVGLGNPGKRYERTRHNIGFEVVQTFAQELGLSFKKSWWVKGKIAEGELDDQSIVLLLPTTYMNLSGKAVKQGLNRFHVSPEALLVVVDDVALPFGSVRLRTKGSSGGQKGLAHIEEVLGSQEYARLRVGIGHPGVPELKEYVLGEFTNEEQKALPDVIHQSVEMVRAWIADRRTT